MSEIITRRQIASYGAKTLDHSAHLWSEVLSTTHGAEGSRYLLNDGPVAGGVNVDLMGALC